MRGSLWTPEEDALVRAMWFSYREREVAMRTGRSVGAVKGRARTLGLRRETIYTPHNGPGFKYSPDRKCTPTNAIGGTREKIAVLAARVAANEELWHPDDRFGIDDDDT